MRRVPFVSLPVLVVLLFLSVLGNGHPVHAVKDKEFLKELGLEEKGEPPRGAGLEAFGNIEFVREVLVALVISTVLGAIIAYHPRTFGKASTLEELDQPKILIMYGMVGSVVAEVVRAYPQMAFVIFGIGGLLRFRTDVGHARDTGRVILVTVVGLACGLKIYVVAVLATLFGWLLIYLLEATVVHRLTVKGLDESLLAKAADAHEESLRRSGCRVMSEKKNFPKKQVSFVFRAPGKLDRDQIEERLKEIPASLQGAVDWETT